MKRISNALSSFRDSLISPCFPSRRSLASQAMRRLDVDTQIALAETVQDDINRIADELQNIEDQLLQATAALKEACAKEALLGDRSISYRKIVDEQARFLRREREYLTQLEARKGTGIASTGTDDGVSSNPEVTHENDDIESVEKEMLVAEPENDMSLDVSSLNDLSSKWAEWEKRMEAWEKDNNALELIEKTQLTILTKCELMRRNIFELENLKNKLLLQSQQCQTFVSQAKAADNVNEVEVSDPEATVVEVAADEAQLDVDIELGIPETELVSSQSSVAAVEDGSSEMQPINDMKTEMQR